MFSSASDLRQRDSRVLSANFDLIWILNRTIDLWATD